MTKGMEWIESSEATLGKINDTVWQYAETGLEEIRSSQFLAEVLREHGFTVESDIAGMPTAFIARFGTDGPEIGFLAEYDALPELSQKVSATREKEDANPNSGHGCGHNTLAAAILGGAIGLSKDIASGCVKGRVTVFGCPAEELLVGKVKMAEAGVFNSCSILFSCHPNDVSYVWARTSCAVWSGKFSFSGVTAHAAIDPYNGRSALDAVELMDVGANYLREHVPSDVRIHYVITDGGRVPNVVPAKAEVWYTLRAKNMATLNPVTERVAKLAEGASIMTETSWKRQCLTTCQDVLRNHVLEQVLLEAMRRVGPPAWTEKEYQFAEQISKNLPKGTREAAIKDYQLSDDSVCRELHAGIYDGFYKEGGVMSVSTDVGDASHIVPTGVFSFASVVIGAPGHSWFYTACSGSSIAHKGCVMAAKVLLTASEMLLTDTDLIQRAHETFLANSVQG